jgi:hypothetical protein
VRRLAARRDGSMRTPIIHMHAYHIERYARRA